MYDEAAFGLLAAFAGVFVVFGLVGLVGVMF